MSSPFPLPDGWGWDTSRFVPVPDQFFDLFLPHLSPSEKSVLLYVFRRTLGFRKTEDAISMRQLLTGIPAKDQGTGLHRETLRRAVNSLLNKRLLSRRRNKSAAGRDLPSSYSLPIASPCRTRPPLPAESAQRGDGKCSASESPSNPPPQDTEIQIDAREETLPAQAAYPPVRDRDAHLLFPSYREPTVPQFENEHLRRRWQRIFACWNARWPLDKASPYERRLAYRQIEEAVRDPNYQPPPPDWRPPSFDELLNRVGIENKGLQAQGD